MVELLRSNKAVESRWGIFGGVIINLVQSRVGSLATVVLPISPMKQRLLGSECACPFILHSFRFQ